MVGEPTELKLGASPSDFVALRKHPHFSNIFRDPVRETLESVYFDSDNRSLRDHGLTLRVRHQGDKHVQTVNAINDGVGSFERAEWEQTIDDDQPDLSQVKGTALDPIFVDEEHKALKRVFETRIVRTAYHMNGNGADIILALDQGEISAAGSSRPVSEIELELKHGNTADLFQIARDI